MTQSEIKTTLLTLFPNRQYSPQDFSSIMKKRGNIDEVQLDSLREDKPTIEWLKSIGFEPLEKEMQTHENPYHVPKLPEEGEILLSPLFLRAFRQNALIGNIEPSQQQSSYMYKYARNGLIEALNGRTLSDFESDLLVLETILLLRNWNDDSEKTEDDEKNTLWEYICNQYAIPYDDFGNSMAYRVFKQAIRKSLKSNYRLFAQSGKRYYTTLLTHALAPKSKFYILFEQIFAFYAKSLRYHYINGDPAFRAFSFAMQKRFLGTVVDADEDIYIKNMQSSSAIKLLFETCPYYMCKFVENIIRVMDVLVSTGEYNTNSYIETLLKDWYTNRSRDKRIYDQRERQLSSTESIETDYKRINLIYRLVNEQIKIVIPSIRLGERVEEALPVVSIFIDDTFVYRENLRFFGNSLCITSNRTEIDINRIDIVNSKICPRVVIDYGGNKIYDSKEKLYRNAIVFNDIGLEITKRPVDGFIYLYAAHKAEVVLEALQYHMIGNLGQLYRIMVNDQCQVIINGDYLFPIAQIAGDLRVIVSTAAAKYATYNYKQREYMIFTHRPLLTVQLPETNIEKQYRVMIDGENYPLAEYYINEEWRIQLPDNADPHQIFIINNMTQLVEYVLYYVVIENFSISFNEFYIVGRDRNGAVDITDARNTERYTFEINNYCNKVWISYGKGDLLIEIPMLHCRLDDQTVSPSSTRIRWHKNIPIHACLEIDPPWGHTCSIIIGQRRYDGLRIELGNIIRSIKPDQAVEIVQIEINKQDEQVKNICLFKIAFSPCFETAPLLYENSTLLWCPDNNYIGDPQSHFMLYLSRQGYEVAQYRLDSSDCVIERQFPFDDGIYDYKIKLKENGFFVNDEKDIFQATLIVGDPAIFKFDGYKIIVTGAIMDTLDKRKSSPFQLNPESGILRELQYKGEKPLNGEVLEYPCYEGHLCFTNKGELHRFSFSERNIDGKAWLQVNPVRMWIINEQLIALRDPNNDGLYVDLKKKSIIHYDPKNLCELFNYSRHDFDVPAYYTYEVKKLEVANV